MDRSERFYLIRQRLGQQRSVSTRQLLDELEVSPATLKRDIQYLRDRFQVPIEWNAELGGYTLDRPGPKPPSRNSRACGSPTRKSTPS
jgi:predicted DNA-binding transcriptional regulator YafY